MCQHIHKEDEVITLFPPLCCGKTLPAEEKFLGHQHSHRLRDNPALFTLLTNCSITHESYLGHISFYHQIQHSNNKYELCFVDFFFLLSFLQLKTTAFSSLFCSQLIF